MKKEAVNTFNEGLNFDLNPLTTPNNVLTDCVNGTFITFNGDELALQNDAGNIRINIPDNNATEHSLLETYNIGDKVYIIEDEVKFYYENISGINGELTNTDNWEPCQVKLSKGFYPLGIKEYGGVLYIISGKKPEDMGTSYVLGTYQINQIVFNEIDTIKHYYRSKILNNTNSLPVESNDYWEYIGTEKDYINKFGLVEFGSYPSPESIGVTQFEGKELYKIISTDYSNSIEIILYNPQIINNDVFKIGRKVKFNLDSTLNSNYISRYEYNSGNYNYIPKFYKIKLWHQLNNGFMDLTDQVWEEYIKYKNTSITNNFWFNDPNFEFYCPTQYKGKLAISCEIEELLEFKLDSSPELSYDGTNYEFVLFIKAIGRGDIVINTVRVSTYINDILINTDDIDVLTGNIATYLELIPNTYQNEVINYTIRPIFTVNSLNYLNELPKEYLDKFIIKGSRLISTTFDITRIQLGQSICLSPNPLKRYVNLNLTDNVGNYIDLNLNLVPNAYSFLYFDHGLNASDIYPDTLVRFYDIVNNKAVMRGTSDPDVIQTEIPEAIKDLLENTTVVLPSSECGVIQITININQPLRSYAEIWVTQGSPVERNIALSTLTSVVYNVVANQNFTISINSSGYESVYKLDNINSNKIYNFGLIADCTFIAVESGGTYGGSVTGIWNEDRPVINDVEFEPISSSQHLYILTLNYNVRNYIGYIGLPPNESVSRVDLSEVMTNLTENYDNISEIDKPFLCTIVAEQNLNIIFRRTYGLSLS